MAVRFYSFSPLLPSENEKGPAPSSKSLGTAGLCGLHLDIHSPWRRRPVCLGQPGTDWLLRLFPSLALTVSVVVAESRQRGRLPLGAFWGQGTRRFAGACGIEQLVILAMVRPSAVVCGGHTYSHKAWGNGEALSCHLRTQSGTQKGLAWCMQSSKNRKL